MERENTWFRNMAEKFGHSKNKAGAHQAPEALFINQQTDGEIDEKDNSAGMHETPPFGHPTVEDKDN